jgi:putative endonuclease
MQSSQHCHPERSKTMRKANRFAQSRDLVFQREAAMRDEYIYYVYMTQSASRRALYIGLTSDLRKRVWQHKNHIFDGFSDDYNCTRLVYWESFDDVATAIDREKQLKRWRREKKLWVIQSKNPGWKDLAAEWYESETQGPSTAAIVH